MTVGKSFWRLSTVLGLVSTIAIGGITGTTAAKAAVGTHTYAGTAVVTVDSYQYCGLAATRTFTGTQRYVFPATLIIADPPGGDRNPFNLDLASNQQGGDGEFGISSVFPGIGFTFDYWSLSYNRSNGRIGGVLTDPQTAAAAALNLLFVTTPLIPCENQGVIPSALAIARGATIAGTVTNARADLTVTGATTEGLHVFRIATSLAASS